MPVELPEGFDEEYLAGEEQPSMEVPFAPIAPQVRAPYQWHDETPGLLPPEQFQGSAEFQRFRNPPKPIQGDIFAPLLPLSKLAPSAQTVADALDALASGSPELTQEESESVMLRQHAPDTLAKSIAGVEESVLRGAEGMTSLPMLATLGIGALPSAAGRVASGVFTADMLRHVPEASQRLGAAVESGDSEQIASAAADLAQLGVFSTTAGLHAAAPKPRTGVEFPETMRELQKETGEPNAIQEQQTTEAVRGVPGQPVESGRPLPAGEGAGGVSPGAVSPPGDAGRPSPAKEAGPGGLSLAEERFSKATTEEAPPVSGAKPEVVRQSTSKFNNPLGDPIGTTYRSIPQDWSRWKEVQAEIAKGVAKGDFESPEFMALRKENETIKNKYGGMPPEPPSLTEASPLDHKAFTTTDESGAAVADIPKLQAALKAGEIKGGEAANQLISHLLKPDPNHPLKAIKLIDLTPEELKSIAGGKVAYKGRFTLDRESPAGTIEILTRDQNGQPLTHAEFVKTLNHELTHNAVTTKIDQASPEVKADLQSNFLHAVEQAKGTEFEQHNATSNPHEFLSEAASSPKIQTWLAQMPKPGGKGPVTLKNSVWGQVLGVIKKVLGLPDQLKGKDTISVLDETMRISSELEKLKREPKGTPEERFVQPDKEKWTRATARRKGQEGAISLAPIRALVNKATPAVKAAWEAVKDIAQSAKETGQEALATPRMTDYRRSVLNWSAKLQRSFGEAAAAQQEIQQKVPQKVRREAITNWIQAGGDNQVLSQRMAATADPKLRDGYRQAMKLTPEELAVANQAKIAYDTLGQRGQGADVLNTFKDNYVTQIWDLGKGVGGAGRSQGRTLKERFKFAKASTFPTFFDGEQAGFKPKTKDISELLPVYLHEMNSVIAARQMVEQMGKGVASDGRPLVAPRGTGIPVDNAQGKATLVMPKAVKGDTLDYKVLANQPALQDWRWATKDDAGNPVFLKSDLALHPEAYNRIKSVLGRSAIREWYSTPTTKLAAIPKLLVRGLDAANSTTKRTMLGLLAPFHQVQTGTHGLGHRVNPFGNIPKIDLVNDPGQMDAAKHGLMLLPDRASESQFMEGFRTSGLVSKIPVLGKLSDVYSNYLFHQYIPGLKFKTYHAIVGRNMRVYADDLAAGKVKPEDIKLLSSEQANAAYGHLNYADLGRNPTIQHMMQLGLLAPDFLEARSRFAAQAGKGVASKAGREQMLALATLAIGQATAAYITAKLSGGEWDPKHPFEFHVGARKYTIRSVPEDVSNLISNTRTFVHSRLSPVIGKGALQYLSQRDYAGRKVTAGQTTKELATQWIPITARNLPGVRSISGADRPGAIKPWEQLAGAVGLKISRFNPQAELSQVHADWLKKNTDPKVAADYERNQAATFPVSKYRSLDAALDDADAGAIAKAIKDLRPLVKKDSDILKRMRPYIGEGLNTARKPLFHESAALERKFVRFLEPEQRIMYDRAVKERQKQWLLFLDVWRQRGPRELVPK